MNFLNFPWGGFVPSPGDKLMVPDLTTRDSEYCWWFVLYCSLDVQTFVIYPNKYVSAVTGYFISITSRVRYQSEGTFPTRYVIMNRSSPVEVIVSPCWAHCLVVDDISGKTWWQPQKFSYHEMCGYGDVVPWKSFPHQWPFVRGIHLVTIGFSNKGSVMWGIDFLSCVVSLKKFLNKQSSCWWFETPRNLRDLTTVK